MRGRIAVTPPVGNMPHLISGKKHFALSAKTARSQLIAHSSPPPTAQPWIAPTTTLSPSTRRRETSWIASMKARVSAAPAVWFSMSLRSSPGAEGPPRPAQDQRADLVVGERPIERRAEIRKQHGIQRVQPLRPVEGQRRDAIRDSCENSACHRQSSRIRRFVLPPVRGIDAAGSSVTLAEARSVALIESSTLRASAPEASAPSAISTSTGSRS